jgi:hypothetical protein
MITDSLRRFVGLTSRVLKRQASQRSSIGPFGAVWSVIGAPSR